MNEYVCVVCSIVTCIIIFSLVSTLEVHLEHSDLGQLPHLYELPASITIGQAASTWKHIVIYQHKKANNLT